MCLFRSLSRASWSGIRIVTAQPDSGVAPGKLLAIQPAAHRTLPFRLGRQAFPDRLAISVCFVPGHIVNGLAFFSFSDLASEPVPQLRFRGRIRETSIFFVSHFVLIQVERTDGDFVSWRVVAPIAFKPSDFINEEVMCAAHPEFSSWNQNHSFRGLLQKRRSKDERESGCLHD